MVKTVGLFSTGIPDPTQGGTGIINYMIIRELLTQEFRVKTYLRVTDDFVRDSCNTEPSLRSETWASQRWTRRPQRVTEYSQRKSIPVFVAALGGSISFASF